jgi:hypothetical protein
MRKSNFVLVGAVLSLSLFSIEFSETANAAAQKKKIVVQLHSATGAQSKRPGVVVPLSEEQCVGLGGKVIPTGSTSCESTGKVCYTTDKFGVIRHTCITAE